MVGLDGLIGVVSGIVSSFSDRLAEKFLGPTFVQRQLAASGGKLTDTVCRFQDHSMQIVEKGTDRILGEVKHLSDDIRSQIRGVGKEMQEVLLLCNRKVEHAANVWTGIIFFVAALASAALISAMKDSWVTRLFHFVFLACSSVALSKTLIEFWSGCNPAYVSRGEARREKVRAPKLTINNLPDVDESKDTEKTPPSTSGNKDFSITRETRAPKTDEETTSPRRKITTAAAVTQFQTAGERDREKMLSLSQPALAEASLLKPELAPPKTAGERDREKMSRKQSLSSTKEGKQGQSLLQTPDRKTAGERDREKMATRVKK